MPPKSENNFRLDQHPSSFYAAQLRAEEVEIIPFKSAHLALSDAERAALPDGACTPPGDLKLGAITINRDTQLEFDVYVPTEAGTVTPGRLKQAAAALNRIAEMDSDALGGGAHLDYQEYLCDLFVMGSKVRLHYVSSVVNTEWWLDYELHEDGSFKCVG